MPMEGDVGCSTGMSRLHSLMNTHNTNPYLLSLSLTCLVNVRMGRTGQPGQTIGHPGNGGGTDHLCTRRDIFRALMLVEALLMSVELGAGSGYESRAV